MTAHEAEFTAGFYYDAFTRFEEFGEQAVLLQLSSGDIDAKDKEAAFIWLGQKSREAAAARLAMDRLDRAIANSAKDAAWAQVGEARRANTKATLALIIAVISAVIAITPTVVTFMARSSL